MQASKRLEKSGIDIRQRIASHNYVTLIHMKSFRIEVNFSNLISVCPSAVTHSITDAEEAVMCTILSLSHT